MHTTLTESRFTIAEVSEAACVHPATVWRWISRGVSGHRLRATRIGGRRYVLESDLNRFLDALNTPPPSR